MSDDEVSADLLSQVIAPGPQLPWSTSSSNPLADIRAAMEKMKEQQTYTICLNSNTHVVSPAAMKAKGYAICANCFGPVWLGDPD